jgi:hypothetical protein
MGEGAEREAEEKYDMWEKRRVCSSNEHEEGETPVIVEF